MTPRIRCIYMVPPTVNTSDGIAVVYPPLTGLCGSGTSPLACEPPTLPSMVSEFRLLLLARNPTGARQSDAPSVAPSNVSPHTNNIVPLGHSAGIPRSVHGAAN